MSQVQADLGPECMVNLVIFCIFWQKKRGLFLQVGLYVKVGCSHYIIVLRS